MIPIVETYHTEIETLYRQISTLQEPADSKAEHSPEWNRLVQQLTSLTIKIAETAWPSRTIKIIDSTSEVNKKDRYTNLDYKPLDYKKTVIKILKYYDPQKIFINPDNGKHRTVNFWDYYMYILKKDVYKRFTQVKIEEANQHRVYKISIRKQRKINQMLYLVKKYNYENPDTRIDLYSDTAKTLFMKNNLFETEDQMNKLLELNRLSFEYNSSIKESLLEKAGTTDTTIVEDEVGLAQEEIIYLLNILILLIEESYLKKIALKKQKDDAQLVKEAFEKDIITCNYLTKLPSQIKNITVFTVIDLFQNKKFASKNIISKFEEREQEIIDYLRVKDHSDSKEQKRKWRKAPATLESISLEYNKNKNYGTRRITDFRKLTNELLNSKNNIAPQVKEILSKWI